MKEALKDVNAYSKKTDMFFDVLNLRAYINRLLARNAELESKAHNNG